METCGTTKQYDALMRTREPRLLKAFHLPINHGIDILVEYTELKTIDTRSVHYGFPDEMKYKTIQTGNMDLSAATRAAEGYYNAKLDTESKKELGIDTSKAGWLETFLAKGGQK